MTTQAELDARYGTPSPVRRWAAVGLSATIAVAFLGWVAWAAFFHGNPAAESRLVGYDVVDDHAVDVRVQVDLTDVDEAECLVRALSRDKSVVGELVFTGSDGVQEVTVRTERAATSADVVGCRAEGQKRWR
ncbi:DUF4307 domain-containing protein [Nocardioides daphniae]|uniref:DUF4307 domain-containing protein n=1 Tax=Nocardioides daphniae TaxID=402297 RepID=A0ABQ1Q550_9ACTN|nr:DUF4307 domain-containing protein [Nocardioides daphniae]GGD14473.1 hypothetical protein GCM10007231_11830 [Nocardioides daphniae]